MASFLESNFAAGQVLTAAELNAGLTFTDYTPTWTQSAAITKTVDFARYTKFGKLVIGSVKMTASSAGTGNNKILVGLPVNASANNVLMGQLYYEDASATSTTQRIAPVPVFYESATTIAFHYSVSNQNPPLGSTVIRLGQNYTDIISASVTGLVVASGDIINIQFMYEAS